MKNFNSIFENLEFRPSKYFLKTLFIERNLKKKLIKNVL